MSNGDIFVGEIIGTAILILFGAGVCAAVTLRYSKARASGWNVIAFGWGFGVLAGAYTAAPLSGGHINPAVTLGAVLTYLVYLAQFQANIRTRGTTEGTVDEPTPTLGIFSTIPEIRNPAANLMTEIIAPARDLGPRIVHTFLPIPNKGTSDWSYAWIPVVGPLAGERPPASSTT